MDPLNEFNENKTQLMNDINEMTTNLVLAKDKAANLLLTTDDKLTQYTSNALESCFRINTYLTNMVSAFNKAYSNIDDTLNGIADMIDESNETNKTRNTQINSKLNTITGKINEMLDFLTYKSPDGDHVTKATFLINNLKDNDGSTIKGKTLTIHRLAYILEKYDDMNEQ